MQAPTEAMPLTILASELPPPAFQQPPQAMETSAIAIELPFEGIPTLTIGEGTGHISEINSTPMAPSTDATLFSSEAKTSELCDVDQSFKGTCNEDIPPELQSSAKQDASVSEVEEMELIASPREETATKASANSPPRVVTVIETNNGDAKSTREPETLPLEVMVYFLSITSHYLLSCILTLWYYPLRFLPHVFAQRLVREMTKPLKTTLHS